MNTNIPRLAPAMRSFTLLELMTAVAIVGILASVGYPGYTPYAQRGKNAEAIIGLQSRALLQEQYFRDHRSPPPTLALIGSPSRGSRYPTCTINPDGANGYVLTAKGNAGAVVSKFTHVLNSAGVGCAQQGTSNAPDITLGAAADFPAGATRW